MKKINIDTWKRKDHYQFFSQFEEPFFGVVANIDCTIAYAKAKAAGTSFFLHYLYRAMRAANQVEEFRYRIEGDDIIIHDQMNVSTTINRKDDTFGFAYFDYNENEKVFIENAQKGIQEVQNTVGLKLAQPGACDIHFSALPWIDFTSLSHARSFSFPDSSPKISVGKMIEKEGVKQFAVSVHIHHGLADGWHVGKFLTLFQELMNQ
jgi:chloramphenicol O-acetyltransferase type A